MINRIVWAAFVALLFAACSVDTADVERATDSRVEVFTNYTGTRDDNGINPPADDFLIQLLDRAEVSIDVATMGFSRTDVVDALVRAYDRGVRIRFVGDGRHMEGHVYGYDVLEQLGGIEIMVGNQYHIMHDKFFIVDDMWVFVGTGNTTGTGFDRNDNNFIVVEDPYVAADFRVEFEQMLSGRFGQSKDHILNGNTYEVGDTIVEVLFSPQEDAMGRILQAIEEAHQSIHFMIFAFTKDQVGSALVRRHFEFVQYNRCCDPDGEAIDADEQALCADTVVCEAPFSHREVRGVVDRSQLHGNGPYHEIYRMLWAGIPVRIDGNENSRTPGDYQAGGGRLHSKTMVIDGGTPTATVVTGSFNWSSSATIANDEVLLVLTGERSGDAIEEYFGRLWNRSAPFGVDVAGPTGTIQPGDVVFNEIHWDGWNGLNDPTDAGGDDVYNDEFIELVNTTDRAIDLSMWVIGTEDDFTTGLYPGTVIGPYERFLIADHNVEPYEDAASQFGRSAFQNPDFVMNTANDQRFLRLTLSNADFYMRLIDPLGNVIDEVGDGGAPFAGGRVLEGGRLRNYSMERVWEQNCEGRECVLDGRLSSSWTRCAATEGGDSVRDEFRQRVIATPGQTNAVGDPFPDEDPSFRAPQ